MDGGFAVVDDQKDIGSLPGAADMTRGDRTITPMDGKVRRKRWLKFWCWVSLSQDDSGVGFRYYRMTLVLGFVITG